jgi:hypothetical protein
LAPEDSPALEEELLFNSDSYEELSIVEDELVDEYLHDELSPSDRQSFESHFLLAPEHQEKLRFARALQKRVAAEEALPVQEDSQQAGYAAVRVPQTPEKKRPLFSFLPFQRPAVSYAFATAILLVVVGVFWTAWRNSGKPTSPGNVFAVTLTPGLTRGDSEAPNRILIPAAADTLRLQLPLAENRYQSYEAVLLDADDRTLTTKDQLKVGSVNGQTVVVFDVAANLIPPGDYRVKLSGNAVSGVPESVASYSLRIRNR